MRALLLFVAVTCTVRAQMDNPKPIGLSRLRNSNRFYRYIELNNRATPACNSETAVTAGTTLTIKESADSCAYTLKVAANIKVTVTCSVFTLNCNDNEWGYQTETDGYTSYCGSQDPTKTFPAAAKEATIYLFYDVWSNSNTGKLTCSVKGESTSSGGGGGGGSGGGGGGSGGSTTLPTDCGQSGAAESGRIIQGGLANDKEYPWQAYIYSDAGACGSTIINNQWLLTAAHCVPKPGTGQITACIGSNNYRSCKKTIKSTKIVAHSGYTFDNSDNVYPHDIALAKLAETLTFDDSIKPVCLPASASEKPSTGKDIEIAGWGNVDNNNNDSEALKKAWMKVIGDSDCHHDTAFKLVCLNTSGSNKSPNGRACSGDSGGYGGAKNSNGRAVQYGVASFVQVDNNGCQEPNAYTDVAFHIDWIKQQISSN